MPDHDQVRNHRSLRLFGTLLHDPNLWHLNRHSVARALAIGLFSAFLPVPMQMVIAAALAIPFRANLPIAVALAWITNPITAAPLYYFTYKIGTWILDIPTVHAEFKPSFTWLWERIETFWKPFLVGSLAFASLLGVVGYFATHATWRWHVSARWRERKKRRDILP